MNDKKNKKYVIAMMDILGFRSLLEKMSICEIASKVMTPLITNISYYSGLIKQPDVEKEILNAIERHKKKKDSIHVRINKPPIVTLLSDSILAFFQCHESNESIETALFNAATFMIKAIQINSPDICLRGAIAYGECYLNSSEHGLIYIGKPIAEAYQWEHYQNWIGGILAPSASDFLEYLLKKHKKSISNISHFVEYEVPLKKRFAGKQKYFALDLTQFVSLAASFNLPIIDKETEMKKDVCEKINNTKLFLKWCKKSQKKLYY